MSPQPLKSACLSDASQAFQEAVSSKKNTESK
jgi:hypothetical protein